MADKPKSDDFTRDGSGNICATIENFYKIVIKKQQETSSDAGKR